MVTKNQIAKLKDLAATTDKHRTNEIQLGFLRGMNSTMLETFEHHGWITREMRQRHPDQKQKVWFLTITDNARKYIDTL